MDLISNTTPAVAWQDATSGNNDIYYLQWNGTSWVDAEGTGQDGVNISADAGNSDYPSLAIDTTSSYPKIAWNDDTTGTDQIYYLQWNGSAWVDADGTGQGEINIFPTAGTSIYPDLARTSDDFPAVAWHDNTSGSYEIYYLCWNGSAWVDADGDGQESVAVYLGAGPSLAIDTVNDYPHIAFSGSSIDYLEWWVENLSPTPTPTPDILPKTGMDFVDYVNGLLL